MGVTLSIFLITSILFSTGGHAGSSFRFGTNAREISLANSMVASNNFGFNAFTNPAILPLNKQRYVGSSLLFIPGNRNIQTFTYSQDLPPGAAAAISFFRAGAKAIGIDENEVYIGDLGYSDGYIMLSFGISFSKHISVGISAKTLLQKFSIPGENKYTSNGIAIDLGIYASLENLNLGIKVESGKYNFKQEMSGINVQYEEIIPFRIIPGISYTINKSVLLLVQHEVAKLDLSYLNRSSFGVEYSMNYHIPIFFRIGVKHKQWKEDYSLLLKNIKLKPSLGIGCQLTLMNKLLTNLDYGVLIDKIGMHNLFSMSIEL